ncbi:NUDIX hydrolase [Kribbella sp. NBC_01245]|uniref:NUDIX hydrolase n=1 Tax=Kribbella sp. NBC_01245 TaxID=2903578 RepID=UPI002E28CDA2|nr:NUDIX hydrolase [Kribbella sp. NBC_01245]
MNEAATVIAAGGVVWREVDGQREVLLVHRPRYDDWSLPKGKLDGGEHVLVAARREIQEETGQLVTLGPSLGIQRYDVRKNGSTAPKLVHYWSASPCGKPQPFVPNDEIDELEWLPVPKARKRLSYPRDMEILDALADALPVESSVVVIRHTSAVKRKEWDGKDQDRPLTAEGAQAAQDLIGVLGALGVNRIITSDAERCRATIAPYAAEADLTIHEHPEISERGYGKDPDALTDLRGWKPGKVTVICSHRPVLPALSRALDLRVGKFSPGAFVTAHRTPAGQFHERFRSP